MEDSDTEFDAEPTAEQEALISRLLPQQIAEIEQALLKQASPQWRKTARVVGTTMLQLKDRYAELPDVYFAKRVAALVGAGTLEVRGDLRRMRFSEVRLPTP